jgi:hypothetical protein
MLYNIFFFFEYSKKYLTVVPDNLKQSFCLKTNAY